jgi:hypothetical protein
LDLPEVYMQTQVLLFFLIAAVWLLGVSIALFRIYTLFNRLTKGVDAGDLKKILTKVLSDEEKNSLDIKSLTSRISNLEEDGRLHIQKVGITRFNPFKEVGGDHSFSLAILDAQDTGVIITSLHTRDRTRVYMKDLKKGKSGSELSEDERKALTAAKIRK